VNPDAALHERKVSFMPPKPTDAPLDGPAEVSVITRLLDPPEARTIAQLHALITDMPAERVDAAVTSLIVAEVIRAGHGGTVQAASALDRLDALGLVAL
jgi:hypothetical protein